MSYLEISNECLFYKRHPWIGVFNLVDFSGSEPVTPGLSAPTKDQMRSLQSSHLIIDDSGRLIDIIPDGSMLHEHAKFQRPDNPFLFICELIRRELQIDDETLLEVRYIKPQPQDMP